ncbi:hypothetical protein [Rheinheimera maricola]|uniref:Helix-turn-helix domain-containing protein n=1 Tax=Rheinheimera maricola TaxID=2793282 RepID=A0ABS7X9D8_9GAMM|nr:hypothetical protein [Rheinheimera maricola]MBZ9612169.1 hypothetical protein [Rheinheimera maricola]
MSDKPQTDQYGFPLNTSVIGQQPGIEISPQMAALFQQLQPIPPHEQRGLWAQEQAQRLGVSVDTIYRVLAVHGVKAARQTVKRLCILDVDSLDPEQMRRIIKHVIREQRLQQKHSLIKPDSLPFGDLAIDDPNNAPRPAPSAGVSWETETGRERASGVTSLHQPQGGTFHIGDARFTVQVVEPCSVRPLSVGANAAFEISIKLQINPAIGECQESIHE